MISPLVAFSLLVPLLTGLIPLPLSSWRSLAWIYNYHAYWNTWLILMVYPCQKQFLHFFPIFGGLEYKVLVDINVGPTFTLAQIFTLLPQMVHRVFSLMAIAWTITNIFWPFLYLCSSSIFCSRHKDFLWFSTPISHLNQYLQSFLSFSGKLRNCVFLFSFLSSQLLTASSEEVQHISRTKWAFFIWMSPTLFLGVTIEEVFWNLTQPPSYGSIYCVHFPSCEIQEKACAILFLY